MLLELTVYIVLPPLRSRDPVCKVRDNDNGGAKGKKTGEEGRNASNTKKLTRLQKEDTFL